MRYRFGDFVLDLDRRELSRLGAARPLSPQVLAFLGHLVAERARVVPKRELLTLLWPDAVVGEGSLQRVVSETRSALSPSGHALVRTFAGHGYRFVGEVSEELDTQIEPARPVARGPRYAVCGDVHIAYETRGEGDVDIVLVMGWVFPMRAHDLLPESARGLAELAQLGRLVTFDKRGTGLSDRVKELPTLAQRMEDLGTVLDAVGSERAILLGVSEGGSLAIAFAAAHPERVAGLVLIGAFPRMTSAPDYPHGWKRSSLGALRAYVKSAWGTGATLKVLLPESAQKRGEHWASEAERLGGSPGAALDLLDMNASLDVREEVARIRVPTIVLHAREDRVSAVENGRWLARHIPDAELIEYEGDDHAALFTGQPHLLAAVRRLLAREAER